MRIAILALQGAFVEHERMLRRLGVECFEVRQLSHWQQPKDGLIIPGGESTVQARLMRSTGLFEPIRRAILSEGLPVFGTCAGLILLSPLHLGTMDIAVRRNAYGRQSGSFCAVQAVRGVADDIPMTFVRAPYIERVYGAAEALAEVDGHIVAARQGRQLVTAFHPELTDDTRMHQFFLEKICFT